MNFGGLWHYFAKTRVSAYLMRGEGGENAYSKYTMISNPESFVATVSLRAVKCWLKTLSLRQFLC